MFLASAMMALATFAEGDKVTMSNVTLNPGGDAEEVVISLEGNTIYTAFGMDVILPEGVELYYYEGEPAVYMYEESGSIYPFKKKPNGSKVYTHTLSSTYGEIGPRVIRIGCFSSESEEFTATSGKLVSLYLKATSLAKPGNLNVRIEGIEFTEKNGTIHDFTPTDASVNISTDAKAEVKVDGAAHWSTCVVPFNVSALPAGLEAFTCSEKDDDESVLILKNVNSLEAYQPYILYSASSFNETLSGTADASRYPAGGVSEKGFLKGAVVEQKVSDGYVLQNGEKGVMFYKVKSEKPIDVPSGKCWVAFPQSASSKAAYGFKFDTTGINAVKAPDQDSATYTIGGVKTVSPQKGSIVIRKGRKYFGN